MNKIFTVLRKQQRIVVVPGRAIIRLLLSVIVVQQVLFPNHDNYMNVFLFALADEEAVGLVKMCLFYPNESGHARTDPILNPTSPSDHVHTVCCFLLLLFFLLFCDSISVLALENAVPWCCSLLIV